MQEEDTVKDILIVANFNRNLSENDYGRFMNIASILAKKYSVEIVCSNFDHLSKKKIVPPDVKWPFQITYLEEIGYPRNICVQRFVSHKKWGNEVRKYLQGRKKPDLIYCAIPSLSGPLEAAKYANKNKIPVMIDVQDLWPEAFKMVFHLPIISDLLFAPFNRLANENYRRADDVIAVSQTYLDRAMKANKRSARGHVVFLGNRLSEFDHYASGNERFFKDGKIRVAYCGTLGSSYDLTCVIDALKIIRDKGKNDLEFVVMGKGPREEEFAEYARTKGISANFMGRLPYPEMCGILKSCDMAVNPISKGAAQSIINKHADYAAAGIPVINTQECEEYRQLIDDYRMGFNCANNNPADLAEKIERLALDANLRRDMGENARRCAEEKFDRSKTYREIVDAIDRLLAENVDSRGVFA